MKSLLITLVTLLSLANLCVIYLAYREPDYQPQSYPEYFTDCEKSYANELHCLVNDYRLNKGLPLLQNSPELEKVSKKKSDDMCDRNYFAHNYQGASWTRFLKEAGVSYLSAGENLAKGYETPQEASQALLASPKHYENIVGDYTHLGVYTASCGGKKYTTQTFAKLERQER